MTSFLVMVTLGLSFLLIRIRSVLGPRVLTCPLPMCGPGDIMADFSSGSVQMPLVSITRRLLSSLHTSQNTSCSVDRGRRPSTLLQTSSRSLLLLTRNSNTLSFSTFFLYLMLSAADSYSSSVFKSSSCHTHHLHVVIGHLPLPYFICHIWV